MRSIIRLMAPAALVALACNAVMAHAAVQVRDSQGTPIAQASVTTASGEIVTSDAEGRVSGEALATAVHARGFLGWTGEPSAEVSLLRESRVEVRVLGTLDRLGVRGARVVATRDEVLVAEALTDASGRARLGGLVGGALDLEVTAEGHASARLSASPPHEGSDRLELQITPVVALRGRVMRGEEPVAGARVLGVWVIEPEPAADDTLRPRIDLVTDEKGHFRFDRLPARRDLHLFLVAADEGPAWAHVHLQRDSGDHRLGRDAPPPEFLLDLAPHAAASLTVLAEDGEPLSDRRAFVALPLRSPEPKPHGSMIDLAVRVPPLEPLLGKRLDDHGRASWQLPIGVWSLCVEDPASARGASCTGIDLTEAESAAAELQLTSTWRIAVRVVSPEGAPLPQAVVRQGARLLARDADDSYRLETNRRRRVTLTVEAPGRVRKTVKVERTDEAQVTVELAEETVLTGRVLDPEGGPVPRFSVRVLRRNNDDELRDLPGWGRRSFENAEGEFRLDSLPAGLLAVRVEAEELLPAVTDETAAEAGQVVTLGDVWLERGLSLSGSVVDAKTREPVQAATVSVERQPFETVTDEQGRWRLDGLPAGEWIFTARHDAYPLRPEHSLPRRLAGDAPGEELMLALQRGGAVEGRVLDAAGLPLARHLMGASAPGEGKSLVNGSHYTNAEGDYRIEALPEGTVRIRSRWLKGLWDDVEVRAGETVRLDLRDRGVRLSVRIVFDGVPLDALVDFPGAGRPRRVKAGEPVVAESVEPGLVSVFVMASHPESGEKLDGKRDVRVPEGALKHEVTIDLGGERAELTVEIRDRETGEPALGWRLRTKRIPGSLSQSSRPAEHRTSTLLLEDGDWLLSALPPAPGIAALQRASEPVSVHVRDGRADVASPLVLEVSQWAPLAVRVLDSEGRPVVRARLAFLCGTGAANQGLALHAVETTDATGLAHPDALWPGPHDLLVNAPGGGWSLFPSVSLEAEEPVVLQLRAPGRLRIEGARDVKLVEGLTGHGWSVRIPMATSFPGVRVLDGAIELSGLPPGPFTVKTETHAESVEIVSGETTAVRF